MGKKISDAGMKRKMKAMYFKAGITTHAGKTSRITKISKRKSYKTIRSMQYVRHLASVLKYYFNSVYDQNEIEVQIAYAPIHGGLWMISANDDDTTETFKEALICQSKEHFIKLYKKYAQTVTERNKSSKAKITGRVLRHALKFLRPISEQSFAEQKTADAKAARLMTLSLDAAIGSSYVSIDACVKSSQLTNFFNGTSGKRIAFIQSTIEGHAEQKILLALCKSGVDDNTVVIVQGTFRPCAGCVVSLNIVKQYYLTKLKFNLKAGHYWTTTNKLHMKIINELYESGKIKKADLDVLEANAGYMGPTNPETWHSNITLMDGSIEEIHNYDSGSDSEHDS